MEVGDISSLLHAADAQRLVTIIVVSRDKATLRYYFDVWVNPPLLVDSSSSDQEEVVVVNATTSEDTVSDSSEDD